MPAPAKTPARTTARMWRLAAPLVLALCGVLLVTSAKESGGDDLRGSDTLELSDLVRGEERRTDELAQKVADLTTEVESLTAQHGDSDTEEVNTEIEEVSGDAGMMSVAGTGLSVSLDDARLPTEIPAGMNKSDYLVHQQDLEGVINALWAGGAEAMTVMGERVVSTSSIKCVGPVLRIDGGTYSPPYTVAAIGDPGEMSNALDSAPAVRTYRQYVKEIGLGFSMRPDSSITMPGYEGPTGTSS